jgi:hypothetical protein
VLGLLARGVLLGLAIGAQERLTVCTRIIVFCFSAFLLFCLSRSSSSCSSYRGLRVAVQCRTYKGHFRSTPSFLSVSQPTESPGHKVPPRAASRIQWVLGMWIGDEDTKAAYRWHEGHHNPKNPVEVTCARVIGKIPNNRNGNWEKRERLADLLLNKSSFPAYYYFPILLSNLSPDSVDCHIPTTSKQPEFTKGRALIQSSSRFSRHQRSFTRYTTSV